MQRALFLCVCCGWAPVPAWAQCPDGTPPPCRSAAQPAAAVRRAPSLDERTWLVLPFDNLTRAPDLDVVRDASVPLLYLEMSRWTDIRVIDDTRVADLVRDVPAGTRLGQEAGFDLARRVGAGKLVMGTLLREGPRTGLMAAVFDVRTRQRIRSPRVSTTGTDSLSGAFGRLAQEILAVPSPAGGGGEAAGTSSTEALRAYAAGMQAYNRWRTDSATLHLRRAVALDSTFAIALFRLYQVLDAQGFATEANRHREAAARQAGRLAPRERLLLARSRATGRSEVCAIASELLRADSTDDEAWIAAGDCENAGRVLVDESGRVRLEGSGWRILRAYERALEYQPNSLFAITKVLGFLFGSAVPMRCADSVPGPCRFEAYYELVPRLAGDSVVWSPVPWMASRGRDPRRTMEAYRVRRLLAERGRDIATRWLAAHPRQWLVHAQLAYGLTLLGDLAGAERELDAASEASQLLVNRRFYYRDRIGLELARERPTAARALLDSMFLDSTAQNQPQYATILGRFSLDVGPATGALRALRTAFMPLYAGVVPAGVDTLIRRYAETISAAAPETRREWVQRQALELGTALTFASTHSGPALDTTSPFPILRFDAHLARGDTGRAREALASLDADLAESAPDWFDGNLLFSAEAHAMLGDSVTALERMRRFGRDWPRYWTQYLFLMNLSVGGQPNTATRLVGRAWLLYGDLAMSRGTPEEARRAYRMVVGLWEGGEPPVQPLVARARAALAQLGN